MNANQWELTNVVEANDAPLVPSEVKKIIVAIGLSPHSEATARDRSGSPRKARRSKEAYFNY